MKIKNTSVRLATVVLVLADLHPNGSSAMDGERRGGIDPSLYTLKGYRSWARQVKRNWSEE